MDPNGLVLGGVDYTKVSVGFGGGGRHALPLTFRAMKVKALPHRRTHVLLNHFVTKTASFLNHFSNVCEEVSFLAPTVFPRASLTLLGAETSRYSLSLAAVRNYRAHP